MGRSVKAPALFVGRNAMTESQKVKIETLRKCGDGYKSISNKLGIPVNTVKSYCQRHGIERQKLPENILPCLQCGNDIPQLAKRKTKKFCCDKCRNLWWNEHASLVQHKSESTHICPICGNEFSAYNSQKRKYCSRICYGKSKGVSHEK